MAYLNQGGKYISVETPRQDHEEDLNFLRQLVEEGEIKAVIDRSYPFEQIPEAHSYVELGHKKGNVVIAVLAPGAKGFQ